LIFSQAASQAFQHFLITIAGRCYFRLLFGWISFLAAADIAILMLFSQLACHY
jgi:hypothetical protein